MALASSSIVTKALMRSEEHTSELQSRLHLVCRLLLEKKKIQVVACDLHPDRQPTVAAAHRSYRRPQSAQGGDATPCDFAHVVRVTAVELGFRTGPVRT